MYSIDFTDFYGFLNKKWYNQKAGDYLYEKIINLLPNLSELEQ